MLIGSAAVSVLIGTFIASSVEVTEMVIIVVGVGATRGWRSTWIGAGAGLTVLAGIIAGLGQALQLIPIDVVRVIIGALLLTFGLQWYRKGVIQVAADGFSLGTEEEEVDSSGDTSGAIDWTAFVLSFKGVLLEGLEVAFIVVAFGAGGGRGNSGSGSYGAAYVGAAAAFVFIGVIGLIAKRQLERVPGRTLKFGVGGLLSTFGTFWALEGLGVRWPGGDLSLAWLYGLYLASTFGVMYAIRRGSLGPVPSSSLLDPGVAGPDGLAPASAVSIRAFQKAHGLQADGVVGARTQAAMRAVRTERGVEVDPSKVGVDAADRNALLTLQDRLDLEPTGVVDGETRGAIRLLQHPGIVDPLDSGLVAAFQREYGLTGTGCVDEQTRVALAAVLSDSIPGTRPPRKGEVREALDPVSCFLELDAADPASVCRFQASLAIPSSGDIDPETRGAMRALRAWLVVDPLDPEAIREVQRSCGLRADAVIGEKTRAAIAEVRRSAGSRSPAPHSTEPDPFRRESVERFQRRHRLDPDGTIGPRTRQALRWEREHHLSVDAAWRESVLEFQRRHGLVGDGVAGPRTQAALQAARREREADNDKEARARYGEAGDRADERILDPADPEQIRRFQSRHRLPADGVIGPKTQTAMRSVRRERVGRERVRRNPKENS
ncbi:MAG TPA: peptidoglycan-binding protein [Solirubrobacteraceae bacterium]|nr:peptidoglycan-binding protein [Solirubrobacteraceae bacterium]